MSESFGRDPEDDTDEAVPGFVDWIFAVEDPGGFFLVGAGGVES
jgi:hypothetical protein